MSKTFKINKTTKRYLISSVVSFFGGFLLVIVQDIDNITLDSFKDGSFVGMAFLALRAGVKALAEYLIIIIGNKK